MHAVGTNPGSFPASLAKTVLALTLSVITSTNIPVTRLQDILGPKGVWDRRRISPMGWDSHLADG